MPQVPQRTWSGESVRADQADAYRQLVCGSAWERVSASVYPVGSGAWYTKLGNAVGQRLGFDEVVDYSDYALDSWRNMTWRWAPKGTQVCLAFGIYPPSAGTRERENLRALLGLLRDCPTAYAFVEAYPMGWRGPTVALVRGPEPEWLALVREAGLGARAVYGISVTRRTDLALRDGRPDLSAFEPSPALVRDAVRAAMSDWSAIGCEHVGVWGAGYDVDKEAQAWAAAAAEAGLVAGRDRRGTG